MKIRIKLLAIKTLCYRTLSFAVQTLILWFLIPLNLSILTVSIILSIIKTVLYFVYDSYFVKMYRMSNDKGFVLWATGLPCSGKTTLLDAVNKELIKRKILTERLDGDTVRKSLCKDLGFSEKDRKTNLERISFVSKRLSRNGVGVLCSFISPIRKDREEIKKNTTNFIEIYVCTKTETCINRDVKGMWKKAKDGEIKNFTGYNSPYEKPLNPSIICYTDNETVQQSVQKITTYLKQHKLI